VPGCGIVDDLWEFDSTTKFWRILYGEIDNVLQSAVYASTKGTFSIPNKIYSVKDHQGTSVGNSLVCLV